MSSWPQDVGILALELIFPSQYVDQAELEQFDGVSTGKYTIGLGQQKMGFCTDREDINSLCLTATQKLMERHGIKPTEIGRLEVGTVICERSKSIKTILMQLFEPYGVTDLEGIDSAKACYSATAALFNSIAWVESSAWNGRYALVVTAGAADIHSIGPARPTGGAGAIAMLVGPNAPLVFDRGVRATYVKHTYEFYGANLMTDYPIVDRELSIQCYLNALDQCYQQYCQNISKKLNIEVDLNYFDSILFNGPYCKHIQKSLARVALIEFVKACEKQQAEKYPELVKFSNVKLQESYLDRDIEKAFLSFSKDIFEKKTSPSLLVARQVGNMYAPSLYASIVSLLVSKNVSELAGKKIALFSYGSGLISSLFSITITENCSPSSPLQTLVSNLSHIKPLLEQRQKIEPQQFDTTIKLRQRTLGVRNIFSSLVIRTVGELIYQFYLLYGIQFLKIIIVFCANCKK